MRTSALPGDHHPPSPLLRPPRPLKVLKRPNEMSTAALGGSGFCPPARQPCLVKKSGKACLNATSAHSLPYCLPSSLDPPRPKTPFPPSRYLQGCFTAQDGVRICPRISGGISTRARIGSLPVERFLPMHVPTYAGTAYRVEEGRGGGPAWDMTSVMDTRTLPCGCQVGCCLV